MRSFNVLTGWLRGHEHHVAEIIAFPFAPEETALADIEALLLTLPGVYRTVRITSVDDRDVIFGRRDLRWQTRALIAMNSLAFEQQPLGRTEWAKNNRPGLVEFTEPHKPNEQSASAAAEVLDDAVVSRTETATRVRLENEIRHLKTRLGEFEENAGFTVASVVNYLAKTRLRRCPGARPLCRYPGARPRSAR